MSEYMNKQKKERINESMNALANKLMINRVSTLKRISLQGNMLLFVKHSNILIFAV